MANHSSDSLEMPLRLSAFSNVLPQVICGQPTGRECATQLFSNYRGARFMGIRATVRRGQPNEETDCTGSCRCQGGPSDEKDLKTRGSDMVAEGMMQGK